MSVQPESSTPVCPIAVGHPRDRWEERGDGREFFDAFGLAPVVEITRPGGKDAYPDADEVRMYKSGKMDHPVLFLVENGRVKTVRPTSETDLAPSTLKTCSGCGGVHEIVFTNACPHCSPEAREII
ncbi:hypothetical protein [Halorubrum lipolyticum]|uniref:hypothetical protein n=1 Tax=Halorubrum lipolyticum TaxID=368624 RepID=UPI0011CAF514|nr:hypothetical protein [Halorubrum lipolyticum]